MRRLQNIFDLAENLSDVASGDRVLAWVVGIAGAVALGIYGVICVAGQTATLVGGRPVRVVEYAGSAAVALGITYMSVACFMHCHFFWSHSQRFHGYAQIGKLAALAGIVGGTGYFIVQVFVFG